VQEEQLQQHMQLHQITVITQYLDLLQQLQVVAVDLGMVMQVDQVDPVVVVILDQTVQDLIITLAQMTAVIKIWEDEELRDKVFLEVLVLDLIVKAKTVIELVVVVAQAVRDLAARTIVVWATQPMAVQAQPMIF
jgi:hypothetical protein